MVIFQIHIIKSIDESAKLLTGHKTGYTLLCFCFEGSGKFANDAVKGSLLLSVELEPNGSVLALEKASFSGGLLSSVLPLLGRPSNKSVPEKKSEL